MKYSMMNFDVIESSHACPLTEIEFDNSKKCFICEKNPLFDRFFDKKHEKTKKTQTRR
jgi:hypothetical protein